MFLWMYGIGMRHLTCIISLQNNSQWFTCVIDEIMCCERPLRVRVCTNSPHPLQTNNDTRNLNTFSAAQLQLQLLIRISWHIKTICSCTLRWGGDPNSTWLKGLFVGKVLINPASISSTFLTVYALSFLHFCRALYPALHSSWELHSKLLSC